MTASTLTPEQVEEGKRLLAAVDQAYRDAPDDAPAVVRGALVSAAVDQFKWWALVNRRAIFATLDAQRERIKDAEAERDAASRRADGLMAAMRAARKHTECELDCEDAGELRGRLLCVQEAMNEYIPSDFGPA